MLKKLSLFLCMGIFSVGINFNAFADDYVVEEIDVETVEESPDVVSNNALENYEPEGSLFERITDLEQDKVVMQLEAERIKMDLQLDELNAKKMKMQMELDELAGKASQKEQELEAIKAQLEEQTEQLRRQVEALEKRENTPPPVERHEPVQQVVQEKPVQTVPVINKYRLINIVGLGNQLQATVEDLATGQNKRISVGKQLDGYTVKSISLNDGIVFEKDGYSENLNSGR